MADMFTTPRSLLFASFLLSTSGCIFGDPTCDLGNGEAGVLACDWGTVPPTCSCEPESNDEVGSQEVEGPYEKVQREFPSDAGPGVIVDVAHPPDHEHQKTDALAYYVDTFPTQAVTDGEDFLPATVNGLPPPTYACETWTSSYPCFQHGREVIDFEPLPWGFLNRNEFEGNWCRTCLEESKATVGSPQTHEWLPAIGANVHVATPCFGEDSAVRVLSDPTSVSRPNARWQWLSVHTARWTASNNLTVDELDGCETDHIFADPTQLPMWCLTADQGCNGLCNSDADCDWMDNLAGAFWPAGEAQCENWPITRSWNAATYSYDERPHGCFWSTAANGGMIPPLPMPGGWLLPACEGFDCTVPNSFAQAVQDDPARMTVGLHWSVRGPSVVVTNVAPHSFVARLSLPLEVGDILSVAELIVAGETLIDEGWADVTVQRGTDRHVLSVTVVE
jgi:hypothetical protein